jgi:tetratricopeptide (TPR) repeat protein
LIRETRLKYAAELLEDSNLNISEVAYKSGFHSISYFSRSYKDYFGYPPKKHRNQQRISDKSTGNTGKRFKFRILQVHFKIAWIIALFLIPSIVISIIFINRDRKGRIPANNMETNKHFLKGKEYLDAHIYSIDDDEKDRNLDSSIRNLEIAIQLDSTFADAYSYLGSVYIFNLYNAVAGNNWDRASEYLDSGLLLLEKALHFDKNNMRALSTKAVYYELKGIHEEANPIYDSISKNGYLAFEFGVSRYNTINDYYNTIKYYLNYLQTKPEGMDVPPYLLRMMIDVFRKAGFPTLEEQLIEQLFVYNQDTLEYFNSLVMHENWQGNYLEAVQFGQESIKLDSTGSFNKLILAINYNYLDDMENALEYIRIYDSINMQLGGEIQPSPVAAYIYRKNGELEKAKAHLNGAISRWNKQIEFNTHTSQAFHHLHSLADVYLGMDEKEKAMEYLNAMKDLTIVDRVRITILTNWPGFDEVRFDPDFQDVITTLQDKYQKEHTRIHKLLVEEGIFPY